MAAALAVARRAITAGEPPFGAVLVDAAGRVRGECHDTVRAHDDPTRHAETDLVRRMVALLGPDLRDFTLATTVEPCPMCFTSAWLAGVGTVLYGATMAEMQSVTDGRYVELALSASELNAASGRPLRLVGGVRAAECLALFEGPVP